MLPGGGACSAVSTSGSGTRPGCPSTWPMTRWCRSRSRGRALCRGVRGAPTGPGHQSEALSDGSRHPAAAADPVRQVASPARAGRGARVALPLAAGRAGAGVRRADGGRPHQRGGVSGGTRATGRGRGARPGPGRRRAACSSRYLRHPGGALRTNGRSSCRPRRRRAGDRRLRGAGGAPRRTTTTGSARSGGCVRWPPAPATCWLRRALSWATDRRSPSPSTVTIDAGVRRRSRRGSSPWSARRPGGPGHARSRPPPRPS